MDSRQATATLVLSALMKMFLCLMPFKLRSIPAQIYLREICAEEDDMYLYIFAPVWIYKYALDPKCSTRIHFRGPYVSEYNTRYERGVTYMPCDAGTMDCTLRFSWLMRRSSYLLSYKHGFTWSLVEQALNLLGLRGRLEEWKELQDYFEPVHFYRIYQSTEMPASSLKCSLVLQTPESPFFIRLLVAAAFPLYPNLVPAVLQRVVEHPKRSRNALSSIEYRCDPSSYAPMCGRGSQWLYA